jgi:hypothetical protein
MSSDDRISARDLVFLLGIEEGDPQAILRLLEAVIKRMQDRRDELIRCLEGFYVHRVGITQQIASDVEWRAHPEYILSLLVEINAAQEV